MMRRTLLSALAALVLAVPVAALAQEPEDIGFKPAGERQIETPPLTDAYVTGLLATLDGLVAKQTDPAKWAKDNSINFWRLMNRLQAGVVSPSQEQTILARFDIYEKAHPADKAFIDVQRHMVRDLMVGKVAPEIVGKDYDGVEFTLSEYRGKVTVLYFTGQWCGPCRGEYPYERLMLEVHKSDPFAIVSVNSDDNLETAKKAKADERLNFRSWWDGYVPKKNTSGPIATAWNVTGWPAIYVLDAKGVIRFAQLRQEDILKAVRQLVDEQKASMPTAAPAPPASTPPAASAARQAAAASSPAPAQTGVTDPRLAAMIGTWDAEFSLWPRPGGPALTTKATSTITPILGGTFVEEKIEGALMGAPFTTLAWTGFNTDTHQYEATRISSTNTARIAEAGAYNEQTKQLELKADYQLAGQTWHQRTVIQQASPDAMLATSYLSFGAVPEWKGAEIKYTRRTK